jgi:hypothetical protein
MGYRRFATGKSFACRFAMMSEMRHGRITQAAIAEAMQLANLSLLKPVDSPPHTFFSLDANMELDCLSQSWHL